jgi:hypothetical protein
MKTVVLSSKGRGSKELNVEADGCVVNIMVGVVDEHGNPVTYVSVTADSAGESQWRVAKGAKFDPSGVGLRIVPKRRSKKSSSRR